MECPLKLHPKPSMRKLNMVLGEFFLAEKMLLACALSWDLLLAPVVSLQEVGSARGAPLNSQPGAASPWMAPAPGLSLGTLGLRLQGP